MDSSRNKATGSVLRKLRKDAGLTQVQLAERLGKPQSYISKIESGERGLYVHEFIRLVHALGVSPQTAITEIEQALN